MKFSGLKKQLAWPLVAVALFALTRYFISQINPSPLSPNPLTEPKNSYEWAIRLTTIGLWLSIALIIVRIVGDVVFSIFRKHKGYEAPSLIRDLFSLIAYVISIAIIIREFFPDLSFGALVSGSALVGIILGLALQDTLGNLFAGISLHADKPFQVGDVITVGKWIGVVESITWRAVKLRTFQNHIVLVSNSSIAKESIEVCPRSNANARLINFAASYKDSPVKVINVVREAIRETDNVLRYMKPVVRIRNFGESNIEYEVKYWLDDYARYNDTDAAIRQRIWYAFRRAGLRFAYPTRTLYVERRPVTGDGFRDNANIAERLSTVDIFSPLTSEELTRLARNTRRHIFAPGERIIRAGDQGASMFIINEGRVEIKVEERGETRTINTLQEGDIFGEMALFTGEPRTANVIAADETEVFEINYEGMKRILDKNPSLVQSLSQIITERRAGLKARSTVKTNNEEDESAGLLSSIRRFFHLE